MTQYMAPRLFKSSVFIALILLLCGCSKANELPLEAALSSNNVAPAQHLEALRQIRPSVEFNFVARQEAGQTIVELWLENPEQKQLYSAEAWLSFNPGHLKFKDVRYSQSFALPAPYTAPLDPQQGLLRLGAATLEPVDDFRIKFAELVLEKQKGATFIDFFDPERRASANTMLSGTPYDLLERTESPALVLP